MDNRENLFQNNKIPVFIGITGHRYLRDTPADREQLFASFREAVNEITAGCTNTEFIILTALAAGADQFAAEAAIRMGMKFAVVLPMDETAFFSRKGKDGQPDFTQSDIDNARRLMNDEHCAFVYTMPVQKAAPEDGDIDQGDLQFRETARFISDNSYAGIALWNGMFTPGSIAGTGASVRDSLHGKTYHSNRFSGITIPETRPIYHIYTPGANDAPSRFDYRIRRLFPEPLLESGDSWFTLNEVLGKDEKTIERKFKKEKRETEEKRKERLDKLLSAIDRYNGDIDHYSDEIANNKYGLGVPRENECTELCNKHYKAADTLAMIYQKKRNNGTVAIIWLAGLSYMALRIFSDLIESPVFAALYLVLLACAVFVWWVVERKRLHSHFVTYRALAEGLRVQYYWYAANVKDKDSDESVAQAQDYYLRRQKGHVEWIRYAVRAVNLMARTKYTLPSVSAADAKAVSDEWLGRMDKYNEQTGRWECPTPKLSSNGQAGYFQASSLKSKKGINLPEGAKRSGLKLAKKYRQHRRLNRLAFGCMVVSVLLAIGLAACQLLIPDNVFIAENATLLMFISGALPVLAMIFKEINDRMGYEEDVDRYAWYYNVFKRAIIEVDETFEERYYSYNGNDAAKRDAINVKLLEIGKEALIENADWVMLNEKRAPEVPSN